MIFAVANTNQPCHMHTACIHSLGTNTIRLPFKAFHEDMNRQQPHAEE